MKILWFSCGVTSAVACKIALEKYGSENCVIAYIKIDSSHPDNARFINDCEKWYGAKIEVFQSDKYKDQFDVIKKTKYVNGVGGARCTLELKKNVRRKIEKEIDFDGQIFGFEFKKKEINRSIRFKEQYPHTNPTYPLIDECINKESALGILKKAGIKSPKMYELGYHNNNCIGCVKGGMGYWNKIRVDFPDKFEQMAKAERVAGHSCIKNVYLDELDPCRGRHEPPIVADCGVFCEVEFADVIDERTDVIFNGSERDKESAGKRKECNSPNLFSEID